MTQVRSVLDLEIGDKSRPHSSLSLSELTHLLMKVSMPCLLQVPSESPEHWHDGTFQRESPMKAPEGS